METRSAGNKLQVAGDGYFSGFVDSGDPQIGTTAGGSELDSSGRISAFRPSGSTQAVFRAYRGTDRTIEFLATGEASFAGTVTAGTAKFDTLDNPILLAADVTDFSIGVEVVGGAAGISYKALETHRFTTTSNLNAYPTIDCDGDATFSGDVSAGEVYATTIVTSKTLFASSELQSMCWVAAGPVDVGLSLGRIEEGMDVVAYVSPCDQDRNATSGKMDIGKSAAKFRNAHFSGTVNSAFLRSQRVIQDDSPVIDAKGLIKTLSTLRNATKDETTLEGMRDALSDAIGGLIEKFEHEIATMPVEEAETMEIDL